MVKSIATQILTTEKNNSREPFNQRCFSKTSVAIFVSKTFSLSAKTNQSDEQFVKAHLESLSRIQKFYGRLFEKHDFRCNASTKKIETNVFR